MTPGVLSMRFSTPKKLIAALTLTGAISMPSTAHADGTAILMQMLAQALKQIAEMQAINGSVQTQGENTQSEIEQQGNETRQEIEKTSIEEQNNQRKIYNAEIARQQQAAPYCTSDQKVSGQIATARTQSTYKATVEAYNHYNASPMVRNPAKFEKEKVDEVTAAITSTCDPRIAPPIGKNNVQTAGGNLDCTPEQVAVAVNLLTGRKPMVQPPASEAKTDLGVNLKSEIDNYNARLSIVEQAAYSAMAPETDLLLEAYQKLAENPSIEDINKMSATGGVQRTELVQKQLETQLMIQIYKEVLQKTRLQSVIAAQQQEEHHRKIMGITTNLKAQ